MKVTRLFFEKTDVVPNDTGTELKVCKSFDVVMSEDFHKFVESDFTDSSVKLLGFEVIEVEE